jgi:hypothetical protein
LTPPSGPPLQSGGSSSLEKGYIGVGATHLEEEDAVKVLAGVHTPFILRKTSEKLIDEGYGRRQCHILIGDCYVHGLMDGKTVEDVSSRGDLEQLFLE